MIHSSQFCHHDGGNQESQTVVESLDGIIQVETWLFFDTQNTLSSSRLEKYELIKKWFEFSVFSISGLKERVGENHVLVKQLLSAI